MEKPVKACAERTQVDGINPIELLTGAAPGSLPCWMALCLNTARENRPLEKGAFFMSDQPSRREELSRGLLAT